MAERDTCIEAQGILMPECLSYVTVFDMGTGSRIYSDAAFHNFAHRTAASPLS